MTRFNSATYFAHITPTNTAPHPTHWKFTDLSGKTFSRWTVVGFAGTHANKRFWLCLCECGQYSVVHDGMLKRGTSKSCGCFRRDYARKQHTTHGGWHLPEYATWSNMWRRCTNPIDKFYHLYRDKTPPDSWKDFLQFYKDMGPRPTPKHSIDRIDNDKPYGPENCRWATSSEQARNKSTNLMVSFQGNALCFIDACDAAGLNYKTARALWLNHRDMDRASQGRFSLIPKDDHA